MRKTFEIPIPEDKLNQAVMAGLEEGRIRRERKKIPTMADGNPCWQLL